MAVRGLDVVIVGTPRSGTTLVQRLVTELDRTAVPPETHFLALHALPMLRRRTFPLHAAALREELHRYLALPTSRDLDLDPDAVIAELGDSCASMWDLFASVVRTLAGPAEVVGEKTPEHLRWWRPLASAWPEMKVVAVVRDPRAVVASNLGVPFGMDTAALLAERWRADQRELAEAELHLGRPRCLVLRYEDIVRDADAAAMTLATFLGREHISTRGAGSSGRGTAPLHLEWEHWKHGVDGDITTDRIDGWHGQLTPEQTLWVTRICGDLMAARGYDLDDAEPSTATHFPDLGAQVRRARFRLMRRRERRAIAGLAGLA